MARTGMRKGMGQRKTEPGSKRYIDGGRRPRVARTGWDGPKHEQRCGEQNCWCDHTDHNQCDQRGCTPF